MSFERGGKIEQHQLRGDKMPPPGAHDEVHNARMAQNRPEKQPTQNSGSLEMTNPYQTSDSKNSSGFPGADAKVPVKRDESISKNQMPTYGKPMSDSQFQLTPAAVDETKIPTS